MNKVQIPIGERWGYSRNPWIYFLLFVFLGILLSYFRLSNPWGVLGLAIGLGILLVYALLTRGNDGPQFSGGFLMMENIPPISIGVAILLGSIFLFVRFYSSSGLSSWPTPDEGISGVFSMALMKKWDWRMFYQYSQVPPVFYWLLGIYFKVVGVSLYSLQLFPSILSVAILVFNFISAELFFSRKCAVLSTALLAFNFWFLYTGNFCMSLIVFLFWIWGSFLLLALLVKSGTSQAPLYAMFLGIFVGIGFFVSIPWALVAFSIGLVVWHFFMVRGKKVVFFLFLCPLLLGFVSFNGAALHEGYGNHILDLLIWPPGSDWRDQARIVLSYLTIPFWGEDKNIDFYGPSWGGLFNPLIGGLFLVGLIEWRPWRKKNIARWIPLIFAVNLLPGLLTKDLDMFRVLPILPLVLLTALVGFQALVSGVPDRWRGKAAVLLIVLSGGLDLYHLCGPSDDFLRNPEYRSIESWRAYQILQNESKNNGNGAVLSEFRLETIDQTLLVASQPLDASRNPRFAGTDPKWVGVLVNPHYRPFLQKRFPEGRWFLLSRDAGIAGNTLNLLVVPVLPRNKEVLFHWIEMDKKLHEVNYSVLMYCNLKTGLLEHSRLEEVLRSMARIQRDLNGDPFLESCFFEKVSVFFEMDHEPESAGMAIENALRRGYPAANLYNDYGVILTAQKRYQEARKAFGMALKCPVNYTPAAENLEKLGPKL
jgi:hypothetical protein